MQKKSTQILCPTDNSCVGADALRYAIAMAKQRHAKLTVLHVEESLKENPSAVGNADNLVRDDQQPEDGLSDELAVEMKHIYREGDPVQEIVKTACELAIDQIVIGTHGRRRRHRVDRGSTAEKIVSDAPCAVTVVNNQDISQESFV